MEFGVFTEFESPAGMSHATAFDESLEQMRAAEDLGLGSFSAWMNCGGQMPAERVLSSMRLFAERVVPRLT